MEDVSAQELANVSYIQLASLNGKRRLITVGAPFLVIVTFSKWRNRPNMIGDHETP